MKSLFAKKHIDENKARDVITKNVVEIEKLQGLSEALLGLAKANKTEGRTAAWLDEVAAEVELQLRPLAEAKSVTVNNRVEHVEVEICRAAVQQILTILLDNAIKYSPEESVVAVSSKVNSGSVILLVSDHGIGIKPEEQTKIFERFYRADSARTRTETSGHGLGLAIAKNIAEKNNYTLSVDSKFGKGSTFLLQIV